ncbi:hypothetical protein PVAND_000971 [Polypedilum vanderplanki]|uniref:DM domain-containing protein n=1 Tax=Polypedilum vanderplanki TaxID=319348 RepID=A0A9J6BM51_POLVA|nr:hypothetical protein PVAND_000971 [Polypedilum vanderplanki]
MSLHRIRKEQVCARCRNHGKLSILKNHKKFCPFRDCLCEKCTETRDRQQFIAREIRFHRKTTKNIDDDSKNIARNLKRLTNLKINDDESVTLNSLCEVRRHQMCARCRNHDKHNLIKGHKNNCEFAECKCEKCLITEERRKIMAKQIKENRLNKITSDDDDGYSTNISPETETESFKYPIIEEHQTPPQLHEIQDLNQIVTDEKEIFYIVQSLYEKCFIHGDSKSRLEVLYAFVMLSQGNWPIINHALNQGAQIAEEQLEKHLKMAKFHQYLLSQSSQSWSTTEINEIHQQQQQRQVRLNLKVMHGNF